MHNQNNLELGDDLEKLKADLEILSNDVTHLIKKATIGQVERKIARRPFSVILMAFGAGVLYGICHKFFKK